MENVLSLLTSLEDSELDLLLKFLSEYKKGRNNVKRGKIMPKNVMMELISKRLEETKPDHEETQEELDKRKRDVKYYVQCEVL